MSASSCSTYVLISRSVFAWSGALSRWTWPFTEALAAAGLLARTFRRVVFPDPLGPMRASMSPVFIGVGSQHMSVNGWTSGGAKVLMIK